MVTVVSFEALLSSAEASPSSFLYTTVSVTRFRQPGGSAQRSACSCVSSNSRKHTNVGSTRVKARVEEINIGKHQSMRTRGSFWPIGRLQTSTDETASQSLGLGLLHSDSVR